jgi:hypothetical protein
MSGYDKGKITTDRMTDGSTYCLKYLYVVLHTRIRNYSHLLVEAKAHYGQWRRMSQLGPCLYLKRPVVWLLFSIFML